MNVRPCLRCSPLTRLPKLYPRLATPQAFSSSRIPDDLKSTSPRDGGAANLAAAAGPSQLTLLGPAVLAQDFTASFALPDMTPGTHNLRLKLSPRRVRCNVRRIDACSE